MATDAAPRTRPASVTAALVFVYLNGFSNAAVGLIVLLSRYQVPENEVLVVSLLGAAIILFGLLTVAVASAVGRGSRLGRVLVTIYLVAQFALHGIAIATTPWDWWSITQVAIGLLIVIALWLPPGRRWFR